MTGLFNITHDDDNLNEYDSTVTDGGDLSTGTPGLAGTTARMEVLIDDTTLIYGGVNLSAPVSNKLRWRVYIDPDSLAMGAGDRFLFLRIQRSVAPTTWIQIDLGYDGSSYEIRVNVREDDTSNNFTSFYDISDDQHWIEVYVQRASSAIASDGTGDLYIDGVLQEQLSGLDIYDVWSSFVQMRMGMVGGRDAGTSGTLLLDELVANDDGSEIGPVVEGIVILRRRREGY